MLSRGFKDDRSSSPAGAGPVTIAIMVDATMNASFDRNWAFPGGRNAAKVRSTSIWKVVSIVEGKHQCRARSVFIVSSHGQRPSVTFRAQVLPSRISKPKLQT